MATPLEVSARKVTVIANGVSVGSIGLSATRTSVDASGFKVIPSDTENVQQSLSAVDATLLRSRDSGVFRGGVGSITGATTVTITGGAGGILDMADPHNPAYANLVWDDLIDVEVDNIAAFQTWWYIDPSGNLQQTTTEPTDPTYRLRCWLFYTVSDGTSLVGIANRAVPIANTDATIHDLFDTFGPARARGMTVKASVATPTTTRFAYSPGAIRAHGINQWNDPNDPNTLEVSQFDTGAASTYRRITTTLPVTGTFQNLHVGYYAPGGVVMAIPGTTSRRGVYVLFRGLSGTTYVAYGTEWFSNLDSGLQAAQDYLNRIDPFSLAAGLTRENSLVIGAVIARGNATDLSVPDSATFVTTNIFGMFGGAIAHAGSGFLEAGNNLSDLTDVAQARVNLGITVTLALDTDGVPYFVEA